MEIKRDIADTKVVGSGFVDAGYRPSRVRVLTVQID